MPEEIAALRQEIARLEETVAKLTRQFQEHRHTGLDSKQVDLTDQIEVLGNLTNEDSGIVDGTYGIEEAGVIENTRSRVGQIEDVLQAFGILS